MGQVYTPSSTGFGNIRMGKKYFFEKIRKFNFHHSYNWSFSASSFHFRDNNFRMFALLYSWLFIQFSLKFSTACLAWMAQRIVPVTFLREAAVLFPHRASIFQRSVLLFYVQTQLFCKMSSAVRRELFKGACAPQASFLPGVPRICISVGCSWVCTCSGSTYIKIGTIQRRLAWPLRKDDTQIREAFQIFDPSLILWSSWYTLVPQKGGRTSAW